MSGLFLLPGVALLYLGGELLVRNAALLARAAGLSPLVVGLTVVAFGTSAPELAASLAAALSGAPGIAYGNVVGSNIANLGLILGLSALLSPISVGLPLLRRELPFMVLVALLLFPLTADGRLDRWEGGLLLLLLAGYLLVLFASREGSKEAAVFDLEYVARARRIGRHLAMVAVGVLLLVLGARSLVEGAVALARALGVSEAAIGLSVVAVGTSLPELAAALVAALRREGDLVLGNVVGSNIFNGLGILGATVLARPLALRPGPELWLLLAFSLFAWLFLWTGRRLGRREGGLLLLGYGAWIGWLH